MHGADNFDPAVITGMLSLSNWTLNIQCSTSSFFHLFNLNVLFLSSFPLAIITNITVFGDASCFKFHLQDVKLKDLFEIICEPSHLDTGGSKCPWKTRKIPFRDHYLIILLILSFPSCGKLMQYGSQSQGFIRHVRKIICLKTLNYDSDHIPKVSKLYITRRYYGSVVLLSRSNCVSYVIFIR